MLFFWIGLAAVLLLLLAGLLCALAALLRVRAANPLDPKLLGKSSWKHHIRTVMDGVTWLDEHTKEEHWIESYDGLRLYARFCPADNARGTVLRMHGYRSEGRVDFSCVASYYHSLGFNLLLADQRAHGKSDGHFITYGLKERYDCQRWAEYLAKRFGPNHPIVLSGISMGAATVLMASNLPLPESVRGIVADCGFTSPRDIIRHVMRWRYHVPAFPFLTLTNLWAWILTGKALGACSATACVQETKLPILFLHGAADRFVPCWMSEQNYEACQSEKELVLVDGATHGLSFVTDPDRCKAAMDRFLQRLGI